MRYLNQVISIAITLSLISLFSVLSGCTTVSDAPFGEPRFLAHRGLAQTFDIKKVIWDTNTAAIIYPPEHGYIENTIPSMKAAFDYGADIVEFDIRLTKDKELVVFHDYLVDFRTEKKGRVSDYTLAELQKMDVGYGYTSDGGATYPLRGTGIGLMPSFDEVIGEFPGKEFLVHIRDAGPEIGEILLDKLIQLEEDEVRHISIYGNDEAIRIIRKEFPTMKALTVNLLKPAVLAYELIGWTGIVPRSMHNLEIHLPLEYARFLWGWPDRFLRRMDRVNTRVVIVKKQGQWSGGFDSPEDLEEIPDNYHGVIWTDRIDLVSSSP